MTAQIGKCAACGRLRPLAELLEVTDRASGATTYCCRPSVNDRPASRNCFRSSVLWRDRQAIRLAAPEARP